MAHKTKLITAYGEHLVRECYAALKNVGKVFQNTSM